MINERQNRINPWGRTSDRLNKAPDYFFDEASLLDMSIEKASEKDFKSAQKPQDRLLSVLPDNPVKKP